MWEKLGGAIKGVFAGGVIFVAGFPLLWMNEGCAVDDYKTYTEGRGAIEETKGATSDKVDKQYDGKLVHMIGEAKTDEVLEDDTFKVSQNALKLRRVVEMYQWEEDEKQQSKEDRERKKPIEYEYTKVWSSGHINSQNFHDTGYDNPADMKYSGQDWQAENVAFGKFRLSQGLFSQMDNYDPLQVKDEDLDKAGSLGTNAMVHEGGFYLARYEPEGSTPNPASPEIGDIRIRFEVVLPSKVSILAKQMNDTFDAYTTSNKGSIQMLHVGEASADTMFTAAESAVGVRTWIVRGVGFAMMFIGMSLIFAPLTVLTDVIPIVDQIAELGTAIIAFCIAGACSAVTIALAWVWYRPLVGITLLVIAIGLIVGMFMLAKKKKAAAGDAPAAA